MKLLGKVYGPQQLFAWYLLQFEVAAEMYSESSIKKSLTAFFKNLSRDVRDEGCPLVTVGLNVFFLTSPLIPP